MTTVQPTISGRSKRVYLETFGCQMNELDSELVRGQLGALGYTFTRDASAADVIIYNTCSVREQAENKVLSRMGIVGKEKERGRNVVLGVIGCMAERDGAGMMTKYPQVDLMCGPGELDKLPLLLDNAMKTEHVSRAERIALQGDNHRRSSTLAAAEDNLELLDLSRAFDPERGLEAAEDGSSPAARRSAYVRITRGCNKFCTYCVVPRTRGAEVHRPPDAIVDECRRLVDAGVIEITLLGQTVNHYVYVHGEAMTADGREAPQIGPGLGFFKASASRDHQQVSRDHQQVSRDHQQVSRDRQGADGWTSDPNLNRSLTVAARSSRVTTFADLLHRIHEEVPGLRRLRFVTSYPRDFTDEALRVMADSPRICRYLHVPAQSGSNRILKLMNRGYTVEEYLEFIERARSIMPDISIAGDIIVGFPTETDEDFEATKRLLQRVRYKNCFIFKYSPRPGTVAIDRFTDDVPDAIKRRRNNELLRVQSAIGAQVHAEQVGRTVEVLVEGVSVLGAKTASRVELRWQPAAAESPRIQMTGRTGGDLIVAFDAPEGVSPDDLVSRILPVRVTGSGPLILRGELVREGVEC